MVDTTAPVNSWPDLAGRLHHLGNRNRFINGGATFDQFVAAEANAESKGGAQRLADRVDDLEKYPRPELQRSTVPVLAGVGCPTQKPPHNRGV